MYAQAYLFFLMSRHAIIYIIMIGFENLGAFHEPLLIWLPRVTVVESVHIASIYFIMMWLASALIITTLTMLTIAHADRDFETGISTITTYTNITNHEYQGRQINYLCFKV